MNRVGLLLGFVGLAFASSASAQGFNIDAGLALRTPGNSFGAAAGQPGTWNEVYGGPGTSALVSLGGAPTPATITCSQGLDGLLPNPLTVGNEELLMDDFSEPLLGPATWTISGIAEGDYTLYTYAWAPDSPLYLTSVAVAGSPDPLQVVGGQWNDTYTQGLTHALHHVTVAPGGSIIVTVDIAQSYATLNGFQLVRNTLGPVIQRCAPGQGGTLACPCANPPAGPERGCQNSEFTGGASIAASGLASVTADTLSLTTGGQRSTATSIVTQGTALVAGGLTFGQGVRCASGALKWLYTLAASGGSITAPPIGGPSVSARSAALGDPIGAGQNRWYSVHYRDPIVLGGCPAASGFNSTTTLEIAWQ